MSPLNTFSLRVAAMHERPMRVFESCKSGARVRVEIDSKGVTTTTNGLMGPVRPWDDMRHTVGAKPEWGYEEEIAVMERARWEEK
jgi:hypothetical protein